jgi:hypothetical protein
VTALCPNCGRAPDFTLYSSGPGNTLCPNCYDGAEDSGDVSQLIGYGDTREQADAEWGARVADYLGDQDELVLLERIAECDREIDGGHAEPERLRALGRLLRDELTARHGDAIETVVDHALGSSPYARRITREEAIEIVESSPQLTEMVTLFEIDRVVDVVVRGVARRLCGAA